MEQTNGELMPIHAFFLSFYNTYLLSSTIWGIIIPDKETGCRGAKVQAQKPDQYSSAH